MDFSRNILLLFLPLISAQSPWEPQGQKLVGTDGINPGQLQGKSVALSKSGDLLVIGGPLDNSYYRNIDNGGVWTFSRDVTTQTWIQQGGKVVGTEANSSYQGGSIALNEAADVLAVGGPWDTNYRGACWIFWRDSKSIKTPYQWIQQGPKLIGTGGVDRQTQGESIALDGPGVTVAVGGSTDDSGRGAVWIFTATLTDSTDPSLRYIWSQQGKKLVGTGVTGDWGAYQGTGVAFSNDGAILAVGGPRDDRYAGAVWIWTRSSDNSWIQHSKLVGNDLQGKPSFGTNVAFGMDEEEYFLAVGGPEDRSSEKGGGTGAAWVFSSPIPSKTNRSLDFQQQGSKLPNPIDGVEAGWSLDLSKRGEVLLVGSPRMNTVIIYERVNSTWINSSIITVKSGGGFGTSLTIDGEGKLFASGAMHDENFVGSTRLYGRDQPPPISPSTQPPGLPLAVVVLIPILSIFFILSIIYCCYRKRAQRAALAKELGAEITGPQTDGYQPIGR